MASPRRKTVTIAHVAAAAGVSYQTVSRVINDHPNVSPTTRHVVQQVVSELGYRPNVFARSLVTQRSHRVGVIALGSSYYGPSQTVTHIETALREDGYTLLFATLSAPTLGALSSLVEQLIYQGVDGLVLVTPILGVPLATIQNLCGEVPFVLVDAEPGAGIPVADIDQRYGARLATEHLLALGHTHIAEISGPLHWWDARQRHDSWLQTLAEHGLQPAASIPGTWGAESGYAAVGTLLALGKPFTGLVVANDQMALGAIRRLTEHGCRVPEDVSVVGFDDIPEAAYYRPALTSVRQDFAGLGRRSADLIVGLMQGSSLLEQERLRPTLIARESSAAR